MNTEFAKKLIDLYVDDQLDEELVREFREAMLADKELSNEVESLQQARTSLQRAYQFDQMSHDENMRVLKRIAGDLDPTVQPFIRIREQLEIPWSEQKPHDHRL